MIPFHKRLRALREILGLSQSQLAVMVDSRQDNISTYENGVEPKLSTGLKLAQVLSEEAARQGINLPFPLIETQEA